VEPEEKEEEKALPPSVWMAVIKMITELKCRARLGYFEWGQN